MDSTDIVTKMYVETVEDSNITMEDISIINSEANLSREDYLLNFDYLYSVGAIEKDQYDAVLQYETDLHILNEEIIEAGGHGCVSTNKVFHFCGTISEISRHYSPKYYVEVKPLGPVVENDGALLSNKIEIIRAIPESEVQQIMLMEQQAQQIRI